jgi:hypothetical protein
LRLAKGSEIFCFYHDLANKSALTVYSAARPERKADNMLFIRAHLIEFEDSNNPLSESSIKHF